MWGALKKMVTVVGMVVITRMMMVFFLIFLLLFSDWFTKTGSSYWRRVDSRRSLAPRQTADCLTGRQILRCDCCLLDDGGDVLLELLASVALAPCPLSQSPVDAMMLID